MALFLLNIPRDDPSFALEYIETLAWTHLAAATCNQQEPFGVGTFITADLDGRPAGRLLTVREAHSHAREVVAYTDRRSRKVQHLARDPRSAWAFRDANKELSLTLQVHTEVLSGAADVRVRAAWSALTIPERRCYLAPQASSTLVDPAEQHARTAAELLTFTLAGTEPGLANFAVLCSRVLVLELSSEGSRPDTSWHVRMDYGSRNKVQRSWVAA